MGIMPLFLSHSCVNEVLFEFQSCWSSEKYGLWPKLQQNIA